MRIALLLTMFLTFSVAAEAPATQATDKLPFVQVDVAKKTVRVECENIGCEAPLEFLAVVAGGPEHEAALRTRAKPSHIHLALLMLGLEPGEPIRYVEASNKWLAPHGPPLHVTAEFTKDGKLMSIPAYKLLRDIKTRKEMPALTWIFAGSRQMPDGAYAADVAGYFINIVNFDLAIIDVPGLVSSSNESLQWEAANDVLPARGQPVTLIIQPAGALESPKAIETGPTTQPMALPKVDAIDPDQLRKRWEQKVAPHDAALRDAAKAQYEIITQLRREQQRLIEQADQIQRVIDELEKRYQDMTTPTPQP